MKISENGTNRTLLTGEELEQVAGGTGETDEELLRLAEAVCSQSSGLLSSLPAKLPGVCLRTAELIVVNARTAVRCVRSKEWSSAEQVLRNMKDKMSCFVGALPGAFRSYLMSGMENLTSQTDQLISLLQGRT